MLSLKEHIYPLASVTDGDNFEDLMPLMDILKNVRIVGLGESTHGTREFFQLKHRVTRFLVEKMGYRAFTIEAGVMPCMNINDYVMAGKGDRAAALASQGYWVWDTEEVTDMIEWMRQHNLNCTRGKECQFIGYDIKPLPDAIATIERIVGEVLPEIKDRAGEIIQEIAVQPFPYREDKPFDVDKIIWLLGYVAAKELHIKDKIGQAGFDLLLTACRKMYQFVDGMIMTNGYSGRDLHMAENITFILNQLPKDAKIVVWAHNAHVAVLESWKNMGWWLRQRYGSLYYPFALTFSKGTFQSRIMKVLGENDYKAGALQEFDAGDPQDGYWEKDLMSVSEGDFYFDLRTSMDKDEDVRKWANQNKNMFMAGGGWVPPEPGEKPKFVDEYHLGTQYDGVFHIQNASRSRPTPTGMRYDDSPVR